MLSTRIRKHPMFDTIATDIQAAILEFCGTFLFLLLGLGGIQAAAESNKASLAAARANTGSDGRTGAAINTVASIEQLLYISASMGLSLLISVWLFYRVTGGIFNPAVSTALFIIGAIGPVRWALCCLAQLLGAIAASGVLVALLPSELAVNTVPGPGVNKAQAVFIEMFLTSALVLSVLMLAAEKHRSTPFAPIGVGLTLFAGHLFGVIYTGASMNTARSFGPAVVSGFDDTHWIYWLGPFLGSLLATLFYILLKNIRYWTLNPGQESANPADSPENTLTNLRRPATDDSQLQAPSTTVTSTTGAGVPFNPAGEESTTEQSPTPLRHVGSEMV